MRCANKQLMYDPFGYYKDKNIYAIKRNEHLPFYEDFPVTDSQWFIGESWVQVDKQPMNYLEDPSYLARLIEEAQLSSEETGSEGQLEDHQQQSPEHKY